MLTSLKNNKLKLSGISGISNMVHGKKKKKENAETPEINGKLCKARSPVANIWNC